MNIKKRQINSSKWEYKKMLYCIWFTGKATGEMNMQMNMNIQIKESILRFGFFSVLVL